ncbi:MAG: restriction endonuclease subunit S [Nostoc sp. S4]|nr:restriction endonuclease subunit S [Nostoc sp. S4]
MTQVKEINSEAKKWQKKTLGEWLKLGYIIDIQDGNHGELHPRESEFVKRGIPFVTANCIKHGQLDLSNCKYITPERAQGLRIGFAKGGDVLITHKGNIGFTAVVPTVIQQIVLSPQVTYYRPNQQLLDAKFLNLVFQDESFQIQLIQKSRQATRNYVGITAQKDLTIFIPTVCEQKRITAILDEQLELVEKARQNMVAQLEAAKELPAAYLRAVFNSPEAQKWKTKKIREFAETCSGTTPLRNNKEYYIGTIPWVKTGELQDGLIEDTKEYISESALHKTSEPIPLIRFVLQNLS